MLWYNSEFHGPYKMQFYIRGQVNTDSALSLRHPDLMPSLAGVILSELSGTLLRRKLGWRGLSDDIKTLWS